MLRRDGQLWLVESNQYKRDSAGIAGSQRLELLHIRRGGVKVLLVCFVRLRRIEIRPPCPFYLNPERLGFPDVNHHVTPLPRTRKFLLAGPQAVLVTGQ